MASLLLLKIDIFFPIYRSPPSRASTYFPQFVHKQLYRAPGDHMLTDTACCLALGCSGSYYFLSFLCNFITV